jgi:hypothetical protein
VCGATNAGVRACEGVVCHHRTYHSPAFSAQQAPIQAALAPSPQSKGIVLSLCNTNSFLGSGAYEFAWRIVLNGTPLGVAGSHDWTSMTVPALGPRVRWSYGVIGLQDCMSAVYVHGMRSKRARAHLRGRHLTTAPHKQHSFPQDSADITLPVDLDAIRAAATAVLDGRTLGRAPEVAVELRVATAAGNAWADKVRPACGNVEKR